MDLTNSISNSFLDNTVTDNYYYGILISSSGDTIISNNVFTNNGLDGLKIQSGSSNDIISNNVFTDNDDYAINLTGSNSFSITGNTISQTGTGQDGYGIYVKNNANQLGIIENNNISGKWLAISADGYSTPLILIKNNIIDSNHDGISCHEYCEIVGNTATNTDGIAIQVGYQTEVYDNTVSNNEVGVRSYGYNNLIYRNTISNNDHGISASSGQHWSFVSENNLLSNTVQATGYYAQFDHLSQFWWTNPVSTAYSGNYWDDYSHLCPDTNADNICDDPYPFSGGTINVDDDYVWTVQDGWLSQITNPGNLSLGAADSSGAVGTFSVTATHDGSSMSVTCDTASGSTFAIGNSTVTCTATNGIKTAFTVSVSLDSTSPTVSVPSNITVVSPDNSGLAVTYDVTASDDFAVTTGPTCTPASGSTFAVGTTTVTCTASDAAGNVGTQTFTVTNNVEDVSPVVTVPADIMAILSETETETAVEFTVTATDNFAVTVGPTCTPASGSTFAAGTTTVICTAADAAGNVGTGSFVVTVSDYDDVAPTVSVPSDTTTHEIASNVGAVVTFSVTATDNVAVTTGPTCTPASGSTFSVGDNTVTCTAEDENGNIGTSTFIITVVEYVPPEPITSFTTYTDPLNRFTIDVPSGWVQLNYDPATGYIEFDDHTNDPNVDFEINGSIVVWYGEGYGTSRQSNTDAENLQLLQDEYEDLCTDLTMAADEKICYNYQLVSSYVVTSSSSAADQIRTKYILGDAWTMQWDDDATRNRAGYVYQVLDGNDVWEVTSWFSSEYQYAYAGGVLDSSLSFMAAVPEIAITVDTDKANYVIGEAIVITGTVQSDITSDVIITIYAPNGDVIVVSQVTPNSSGFFTDIGIGSTDSYGSGTYTVRAEHVALGTTVESTFTFSTTEALPDSVTVTNAPGSATPGCETTNACFIPVVVTIGAGGTVTWENTDNAAHTATSGTPGDGPNGVFDSSLIMSGGSYSVTLNQEGVYPYFCMVHPWMIGGVLVGESASEEVAEEPVSSVDLTMNIGNTEYNLNQIITVSVGLSGTSEQETVIIDVLDPEGTPVVTRALTVSPNSSSNIDFKVSENSLTGNYKIVASVTVDGDTVTERIYFKIKSQYNQFQIASVEVTDQQGNSSTLNRGDMAYIKVTLTSDISIEPLVTVNLFDAELTTLGVGSVKSPLNHGESEIILSFLIPDDAALGNADIFVNAFTNWVSSGGIPLTPEFSITANISP